MEERIQGILRAVKINRSQSSGAVFWDTCSGMLLLHHSQKTNFFGNLLKEVQEDLGRSRSNGPSRRALVRWAKSATRIPGVMKSSGVFNALMSNAKVVRVERRVAIIRIISDGLYRTPASSSVHIVAKALLRELGWVASTQGGRYPLPWSSSSSTSPPLSTGIPALLKRPTAKDAPTHGLASRSLSRATILDGHDGIEAVGSGQVSSEVCGTSSWTSARPISSSPSAVSSSALGQKSAISDAEADASNVKEITSKEKRCCADGVQKVMPPSDSSGVQVELPRNMKKDRIGIDATNADKLQRQCEVCLEEIIKLEEVVSGLEVSAEYKLRVEARLVEAEAKIDRLEAHLEASVQARQADTAKNDIAMATMKSKQKEMERAFFMLYHSMSSGIGLQVLNRDTKGTSCKVSKKGTATSCSSPPPGPEVLDRSGLDSRNHGSLAQQTKVTSETPLGCTLSGSKDDQTARQSMQGKEGLKSSMVGSSGLSRKSSRARVHYTGLDRATEATERFNGGNTAATLKDAGRVGKEAPGGVAEEGVKTRRVAPSVSGIGVTRVKPRVRDRIGPSIRRCGRGLPPLPPVIDLNETVS